MRRPAALLTTLVMFAGLIGCTRAPGVSAGGDFGNPGGTGSVRDEVRVALDVAAQETAFTTAGGCRWRSVSGRGTIAAGKVVLRVVDGRIELVQGDRSVDLGPDPVRFSGTPEWEVAGDRFGGELLAQRATWGGVTLINLVGLEEYLRGVLPWEIGRPDEDALEAVKAQAIAARTYTRRHLGRWAELGFDLYSDTRDQVYRGRTGTSEITDRAVLETEGQVLMYGDDLVRAYYSSTCGGHTSTLTDVWDREGAPYLVGFRDADGAGRSWCRESGQFRWTESWSAHELGETMRATLGAELGRELDAAEFGVLAGVKVLSRDGSGRVARLRISTDRAEFELQGDRIRWVLRPSHSRFAILRSTMFRLEEKVRDGVLVGMVARGAGFGHGVGLCQTGALGRARGGQSAAQILEAYYPGSRVTRSGVARMPVSDPSGGPDRVRPGEPETWVGEFDRVRGRS